MAAILLAAFLPQALADGFALSAFPLQFTIQRGSSAQVSVTQTGNVNGMLSYTVFKPSADFTTSVATVGNNATITINASPVAALGTTHFIVQGAFRGAVRNLVLTSIVVDPVQVSPPPPANGSVTVTSLVPSPSQPINFTALGTADWFSMGAYGNPCQGGPCMPARKTGGSGLVGVLNFGGVDSWFYPYTPNFANVTWSDSVVLPNGSATHVNNTTISFQAFAGSQARTLTLVAGINGTGTLNTTLHMTDGLTADVVDSQTFGNSGVRVYTIKFNAATAGHQLAVTLTHTGGELLLYGAALSGTLVPETHYLTLADNLQAFIQSVNPGDTLMLPDGYSYTGHIILPARLATGWVDVKSGTTVPPGTRVQPGDLKAVLISPDQDPVIQNDYNNPDHTQRPARGWRFTGIEMTVNNPRSAINYSLVSLGFGSNPVISDIPKDITFDRCYIHGDGATNYLRGIVGNANNISILNSYLSGFVSNFAETNAINIYSSAGPIFIVNNYLEATGENIMIGGSGPDIGPALVPTGGLIQHNYFFKQPSWRGGPFIVKNLLEFKDGYGFLIDSNVFENCWLAAQSGGALLLNTRTAQGGTAANHVDNITFTNNIVAHAGGGLTVGLYDDQAVDATGKPIPPSQLQWTHDIKLVNNFFDDLSLKYANYSHGLLMNGPPNNLVLDHNTFNFGETTNDHSWWLIGNTAYTPSNAIVTNNDFGADLYGDGGTPGGVLLTGATFTGNNIRNATSWVWSSLRNSITHSNTLNMPAPLNVGADVPGLTAREAAVKLGH